MKKTFAKFFCAALAAVVGTAGFCLLRRQEKRFLLYRRFGTFDGRRGGIRHRR